MADTWFQDSDRRAEIGMGVRFAEVNGVRLAYRVQGEGPPLVLVTGYRLNSAAWPATFIEQLARRFTVITLDNRGTGLSDKPVHGYAIANLARDVCGLLDELGIAEVAMLGYSMGGAIAQEFVRQFPERISHLILCATMPGGPRATYAKASVIRVMRDLDGLTSEQAARRIWKVTYAPGYLEQHRAIVEDQMRREVALPTPLHAADLQFQAFAEFDASEALSGIRCPTLVLTGDLDELIRPQNSVMMAKFIPGAKLVIISGAGHRVLWEATQTCLDLITDFLGAPHGEPGAVLLRPDSFHGHVPAPSHALVSAIELLAAWPLTLTKVGFEALTIARQSIMVGSASRFGDGKPVILLPAFLGSDLALLPLSAWLKALGYRPVTTGLFINFEDSHGERSLSRAIRDVTRRVGRKAVLITHSSGMTRALRAAEAHRESISDVVIFEAPHRPKTQGLRTHFVSSGWSASHGIIELPRILRSIGIELIEGPLSDVSDLTPQLSNQTST
jgi:pimeloyl-ACP methyl ester carboxylesterase